MKIKKNPLFYFSLRIIFPINCKLKEIVTQKSTSPNIQEARAIKVIPEIYGLFAYVTVSNLPKYNSEETWQIVVKYTYVCA
jgi:hypothetical protein